MDAYTIRKCEGQNSFYEVWENSPSGGFRIGTVFPSRSGVQWNGMCIYASALGRKYEDSLCGDYPYVLFDTKEVAAETVYREKCRRKGLFTL